MHYIDNTVQQQHEEVTELFDIPRKFKPGYRLLLQADFARRGTVQAIRVPPLPRHKLEDFEEFKRDCSTTKTSTRWKSIPAINVAASLSAVTLKWHRNLPPAKCRKVTR